MQHCKLSLYGPYVCSYAFLVFVSCCLIWKMWLKTSGDIVHESNSACQFPYIHLNTKDSAILHISFRDSTFETLSFVTSGAFFAALLIGLLQLYDAFRKSIPNIAPTYCMVMITFIGFITHLIMAMGWSPTVLSPFGRITHVVRLGEYLALVPLLMVMMHST